MQTFKISVDISGATREITMYPRILTGNTDLPDNNFPFTPEEVYRFKVNQAGQYSYPGNSGVSMRNRWWFLSSFKESIILLNIDEAGPPADGKKPEFIDRAGTKLQLIGAKLTALNALGHFEMSSKDSGGRASLIDLEGFVGFPKQSTANGTWKVL
jgi:hypothetical protein